MTNSPDPHLLQRVEHALAERLANFADPKQAVRRGASDNLQATLAALGVPKE